MEKSQSRPATETKQRLSFSGSPISGLTGIAAVIASLQTLAWAVNSTLWWSSPYAWIDVAASWLIAAAGVVLWIVAAIVGKVHSKTGSFLLRLAALLYAIYIGAFLVRIIYNHYLTTNSYIAVAPSRVELLGEVAFSADQLYAVTVQRNDVLASSDAVHVNAETFSFLEEINTLANTIPPKERAPRLYRIATYRSTTLHGAVNPFSVDDYIPEIRRAVNVYADENSYSDDLSSSYRTSNYQKVNVDQLSSDEMAKLRYRMGAAIQEETSLGSPFLRVLPYILFVLFLIAIPKILGFVSAGRTRADEHGVYTFNLPFWTEAFHTVYYGGAGAGVLYLLISNYSTILGLPLYQTILAHALLGVGGLMLLGIAAASMRNSRDQLVVSRNTIIIHDNDLKEKTANINDVKSVYINRSKESDELVINDVTYDLRGMNLRYHVSAITKVLKEYYPEQYAAGEKNAGLRTEALSELASSDVASSSTSSDVIREENI